MQFESPEGESVKPAMKPAERRRARQCAVQAIYSWQISKNDVADVELQFLTDQDMKGTDIAYFRDLLVGVALHHEELDRVMAPHLSRAIDELDLLSALSCACPCMK